MLIVFCDRRLIVLIVPFDARLIVCRKTNRLSRLINSPDLTWPGLAEFALTCAWCARRGW